MLYVVDPDLKLLDILACWNPGYRHMLPSWINWSDEELPLYYFVDDRERPGIVLAGAGIGMVLLGDGGLFKQALTDLLEGNLDLEGSWPDDAIREHWEKSGKPPAIELTGHGEESIKAAKDVGLVLTEDRRNHEKGYFFYFTGEPRRQELVQHPCRIVHGLELFDLMLQATDYDEDGTYKRKCLERGPSFVCEIDGEPVCWSCTHINRMMGMIFTPEQHRRQGYAQSLAAFQIDHMLALDGVATCVVLDNNQPSISMLDKLDAVRMDPPLIWRTFEWPRRD